MTTTAGTGFGCSSCRLLNVSLSSSYNLGEYCPMSPSIDALTAGSREQAGKGVREASLHSQSNNQVHHRLVTINALIFGPYQTSTTLFGASIPLEILALGARASTRLGPHLVNFIPRRASHRPSAPSSSALLHKWRVDNFKHIRHSFVCAQ